MAKLVRCCEMALRLDPSVRDDLPYHMIMLDNVRRRIDQFDVLHFHIDLLHTPSGRLNSASLYKRSTIHPQNRAAAAPGFRCERTFSKWH
jgi:hypothetical protein